MSKEFTIVLSRVELNWMYRQLSAGKEKAEAICKRYDGEDVLAKPLTEEQTKERDAARIYYAELVTLTAGMRDLLDEGERTRLKLRDLREDLDEAFSLVEEDAAKQEVLNRLKDLPKEEPYRVTFDRTTAKFTLQLLEQDINKFRSQVIPNYEKTDASEFTDPIMTKSYWINKSRSSKAILEGMKVKLEKML